MMPSYHCSNSRSRPTATRRATVTVTGSAVCDRRLISSTSVDPRAHHPAAAGDDAHTMPEGDTVWLAGRRLHDALAGRVLTRTDFRVPQLATADLTGRTVTEVVSRGKHLLTRIDDDLTLHTHFRMDGAWHLYRPGDRWRGGPDWQVRLLLENADLAGGRLPAAGGRAAAARPRGRRGRPPRPGPARAGLGPRRGGTPARRRPGPRDRPGAARPAQPGRDRQPLQGRGLLPAGRLPVDAGPRGRPPGGRRPGPPAAHGQQGAPGAGDHRRPAARRRDTGCTSRAGQPVPALRDAGPVRPSRATRPTSGSSYWCPRCQPR